MNSEMVKFFLSSGVPSGFVDSEGELQINLTMSDLLHLMIFSAELKTLIEKVHAEKSPFSLVCNLPANFRESPTVWQFHFLPLLGHDKEYLGTFLHANQFLFLSPLDYVDGMQPYTVTMQQPDDILSHREWQIVFLMMHRFSSKEIGRRLNIFPSTVESHLKAIYGKVNVHSACELRTFGKSQGFDRYIPVNFLPRSCVKSGQHVGGIA